MRPHGILLLAAANSGQAANLTYRYRLDTNARGLAKLMEKGFAKFLNDLIAKSARNVKAILEGTTVNVKGI